MPDLTPLDFEQLVEINKEKIFRICRVYAVSPMEPQDLFQEVIFQIWKSLDSFKGKSNIHTWIYKITLNVCMRSKLKLERHQKKTLRYDAIKFVLSEKETAKVNYDQDDKFKLLRTCIAQLKESDTAIIVLYLEEVPYKEIASVTGLSENNVAVKMKRIRKKLFECMNQKFL